MFIPNYLYKGEENHKEYPSTVDRFSAEQFYKVLSSKEYVGRNSFVSALK